MDKLVKIHSYLSDPDNWCDKGDRTFYVLFLIYVSFSSYIMIGLYYYFPRILDMLFWPLNYFRI
jgi:hypothetical protein